MLAFSKSVWTAAFICLIMPADAGHLDSIRFVEVGLYQGNTIGNRGAVAAVQNAALVQATNVVPAALGVRFGFRYVVLGEPTGELVNLIAVTRSATHSGSAGQEITWSKYPLSIPIGELRYREFHFDHQNELMPGRWHFEFWHGEKLLGVQEFCVVAAVDHDREHRDHCGDKVSQAAPDDSSKHEHRPEFLM